MGLIGSEFIKEFFPYYNIIVIDSRKNIFNEGIKITYIQDSINNISKYKNALANLDGVIHLAAKSRVLDGELEPLETWETNVLGTQKIIEFLYESETRPWIIYGSSREVYGVQKSLPVKENASKKPMNRYAISKFAAEHLLSEYSKNNRSSVFIMRFSNVYGSTNDYSDRVIPIFVKNAILNKNLIIEGKNNLFDFTFVKDVVFALSNAIRNLSNREVNTSLCNDYNICFGEGKSLDELAGIILSIIPSSSKKEYRKSRDFDVQKFIGSNQKAKKEIEFNPLINLEEGLKLYIDLIINKSS